MAYFFLCSVLYYRHTWYYFAVPLSRLYTELKPAWNRKGSGSFTFTAYYLFMFSKTCVWEAFILIQSVECWMFKYFVSIHVEQWIFLEYMAWLWLIGREKKLILHLVLFIQILRRKTKKAKTRLLLNRNLKVCLNWSCL